MRETFGINDEGMLVYARVEGHPDTGEPDLLSYDDDIRQKYLENPEPVLNDTDVRSMESTFARLGYPIFEYPRFYLAYSFEERFGIGVCMPKRPEIYMLNKALLSVVAISSFIGDRRLFTCSGIVIESTDGAATILTSACLVAMPESDGTRTIAANVKILVHFDAGAAYEACLLGCCLHYNVAFLRVQKEHQDVLPLEGIEIKAVPEVVFALGRHYVSRDVCTAIGETMIKRNNFDCMELMFSSCKITKCGVGGPLVNRRGDLVGVNFYDKDDTPYLPSSLVLRCWEHIKIYRSVPHLQFGWRVRPLGQKNLALRSKIWEQYELAHDCLLVEEVASLSPVDRSGIKVGDIIVEFFGEPVVVVPVPKYAEVLLDEATNLSGKGTVEVQIKILRQIEHVLSYDYKTIDAIELTSNLYNKWPLPEAEWKTSVDAPDQQQIQEQVESIVCSPFRGTEKAAAAAARDDNDAGLKP